VNENYELTELEIDEISLVDRGANPGAKMTLLKRDVPTETQDEVITKQLHELQAEQAVIIEKFDLQNLMLQAEELWPHLVGTPMTKATILKHINSAEEQARVTVHQFFKAANAALAQRLVSQGTSASPQDESEEFLLQRMVSDYALEKNVTLPVAKKRLIEENKKAASLFKRILSQEK
jgi:hypothetical protein